MNNLTLSITTIGDLLLDNRITRNKDGKSIDNVRLTIPEYQRPYKWTARNAIQLLDDIIEARNENKEVYRVGTLILHKNTDIKGKVKYDIVDGQQRTITFSLLLHALYELEKVKDRRNISFLNQQVFDNQFSRHNIPNNLNAFRRRTYKNVENEENLDHRRDMKRLRDYIEKQCELIVVITDDVSEAFQFFDSQNARGKALYPHDLLKAYHLREMADIDEASDRVIAGPAKASRVYSPKEKKLVAFHEAGHVVVGLHLDEADTVHKVTIVPRGQAGGYAIMLPKEERFFTTKTELLDRIAGLLGGRVAEEIVLGEVSTGAHNDFQKVTSIARAMVTEYGMSNSLGAVQYGSNQGGNPFLGRDFGSDQNYSDTVAYEIDKEVQRIVDEQYARTKRILTERRDLLDLIANTLINIETLNAQQIEHLRDHGVLPPEEEVVESEPQTEKEVTPTIETAGNASINEEVQGEKTPPTVEDLPKDVSDDRPQGIDEDRPK